MRFHIPFTISSIEKLKQERFFIKFIRHKKESKLNEYLTGSNVDFTREQYLAICLRTFILSFVLVSIISIAFLFYFKIKDFYFLGFIPALLISSFIYFSQRNYPKVYSRKREREIEKELISALKDIYVQLNSGIPLFSILVNISSADYGELSIEFKKAVRRINAGEPDSEVLDSIGKKSSSLFFKRTLWQISNGLRSGSDMSIVIKNSIKALNEEQLIQIQNYGNKLNPLIMFYMLISVIIPALSITFLTIISSMVNISGQMTSLLFITLFVLVIFIQIMFLGIIKSVRPSLL